MNQKLINDLRCYKQVSNKYRITRLKSKKEELKKKRSVLKRKIISNITDEDIPFEVFYDLLKEFQNVTNLKFELYRYFYDDSTCEEAFHDGIRISKAYQEDEDFMHTNLIIPFENFAFDPRKYRYSRKEVINPNFVINPQIQLVLCKMEKYYNDEYKTFSKVLINELLEQGQVKITV